MELINKLRNFDLNLLAVFVAVDEHRHITKAAKDLGITQPALSHALGRLRSLLGDPLFVKSTKGMVPTPRAAQLSQPIRKLLSQFDQEVLESEPFNPQTLKRVFKIYSTDLMEGLLLPAFLKTANQIAPGVQLINRTCGFSLPQEPLESGVCDIAIGGFFGELPGGFYQQKLYTDDFACAVRKKHPRLETKRKPTLDDFCSEKHLLIAPGGELRATLDQLLKKKRKQRTIAAGLSSFMSTAWILPHTDCILTAPSRLIDQIDRAFPIQRFTPPLDIPPIHIVQVWHERNHHDPAHQWFRDQIRSALTS